MASLFRSRPVPQCLSCLRSIASPEIPRLATPFQSQVRGKAKKAKLPHTVVVRLQKDIEGYGPKGSVLAIAPGRMRNEWYPRKLAAYVPHDQIKKRENMVSERNKSFGTTAGNAVRLDMGADGTSVPQQAPTEIKLLSPKRSRELLSTLVPSTLDFYRQPITAPDSPQTDSPNAAPQEDLKRPSNAAIYGSVSVSDIITQIKATMTLKAAEEANEDAGRVVLNPEDIKIVRSEIIEVDGEQDSDRIKVLGEFDVELNVKGEEEPVRRKIRINALV